MMYMWLVKSQIYFIKGKVHSTYTNIVQFSYLTLEFKRSTLWQGSKYTTFKDVVLLHK